MNEISAQLKGHFLRLYQIALTDGDFSSEELKMLYVFAKERNVSADQLDHILLHPEGALGVPEDLNTKLEYLIDFAIMIWADGIVTEEEKEILLKYCRKFGFYEENIEELSDYLLKSIEAGKSKEEILKEAT